MSKVLFKKIKNNKYSPVIGIERNIKIVFFLPFHSSSQLNVLNFFDMNDMQYFFFEQD